MAQTWKTLKSGFTFDPAISSGASRISRKNIIPARAKDGLHFAGSLLLRDAIKVQPYARTRWATFWRSQTITPVVHKDGDGASVGFNLAYRRPPARSADGWKWTSWDPGRNTEHKNGTL